MDLRDHSQPCEHEPFLEKFGEGAHSYSVQHGAYLFDGEGSYWVCGDDDCPGGRKIEGIDIIKKGAYYLLAQDIRLLHTDYSLVKPREAEEWFRKALADVLGVSDGK